MSVLTWDQITWSQLETKTLVWSLTGTSFQLLCFETEILTRSQIEGKMYFQSQFLLKFLQHPIALLSIATLHSIYLYSLLNLL